MIALAASSPTTASFPDRMAGRFVQHAADDDLEFDIDIDIDVTVELDGDDEPPPPTLRSLEVSLPLSPSRALPVVCAWLEPIASNDVPQAHEPQPYLPPLREAAWDEEAATQPRMHREAPSGERDSHVRAKGEASAEAPAAMAAAR